MMQDSGYVGGRGETPSSQQVPATPRTPPWAWMTSSTLTAGQSQPANMGSMPAEFGSIVPRNFGAQPPLTFGSMSGGSSWQSAAQALSRTDLNPPAMPAYRGPRLRGVPEEDILCAGSPYVPQMQSGLPVSPGLSSAGPFAGCMQGGLPTPSVIDGRFGGQGLPKKGELRRDRESLRCRWIGASLG